MTTRILVAALAAGLTAELAAAQVLVVNPPQGRVLMLDQHSGAVVDPVFIDIAGLVGPGWRLPYKAIEVDGEIIVTTLGPPLYYRFTADGDTYLGAGVVGQRTGLGGTVAFGSL